MENDFNPIDTNLVNLANFIVEELRTASPYRTGNMQRSIATVMINGNFIDIIIAVDYASYVNEQDKHYHWIQRVLDRCSRAYSQNNVDDDSVRTGIRYEVIAGTKEG